MDSKTFGDSPAAIVLADKVSDNKNARRKVSNILKCFNLEMNAINGVETIFRINFGKMVYDKYRAKCDSLPLPISTYTDNVISTKYKIWLNMRNLELKRKNNNYGDL